MDIAGQRCNRGDNYGRRGNYDGRGRGAIGGGPGAGSPGRGLGLGVFIAVASGDGRGGGPQSVGINAMAWYGVLYDSLIRNPEGSCCVSAVCVRLFGACMVFCVL